MPGVPFNFFLARAQEDWFKFHSESIHSPSGTRLPTGFYRKDCGLELEILNLTAFTDPESHSSGALSPQKQGCRSGQYPATDRWPTHFL